MHYRIRHTTEYEYSDPVAVCHNLVHLAPRDDALQKRIAYQLDVDPEPSDFVERVDAFGNRADYFSIQMAHRKFSLTALSEVEVVDRPMPEAGPPWEQVRDALPVAETEATLQPYYLAFASPLVPLDPRLADFAAISFSASRPLIDALRELTARIHDEFRYDEKATTVSTPVLEAFDQRAGVCQDFAHVEIACLRSIGLAARYVSGYLRTEPPPGTPRLVGADASHAWLSLYCGEDGWVDADPTNNVLPATDHVALACGRDYGDVCPIQGVYTGGGSHTLDVSVDVAPLGQDAN